MNADPGAVILLLLFGGVLYNWLVDYAQRQLPRVHGLTAWLVVGGVLWTLVGLLLLTDRSVFLAALLCFGASGLPMIVGSMVRYQRTGGR